MKRIIKIFISFQVYLSGRVIENSGKPPDDFSAYGSFSVGNQVYMLDGVFIGHCGKRHLEFEISKIKIMNSASFTINISIETAAQIIINIGSVVHKIFDQGREEPDGITVTKIDQKL